MRVLILRVPAHEAASALQADHGDTPYFWRARLSEWRRTVDLEPVSVFGHDLEDMEENASLPMRSYRFIGQKAAARLWQDLVANDEARQPPLDLTPLLQDLSEQPVGSYFKVILKMVPGMRQAHVKVQAEYRPQPEERPNSNWPLPRLRAPRYLFQHWSLNAMTTCHVNEPFLLGLQMEPPNQGQAETENVLMAFGRVVLAEDAEDEAQREQPRIQSCRQIQTWTLAVDKKIFLPWMAQRISARNDGEALKEWLAMAGTKSGAVGVAGIAAVALPPSGRGEISSALQWSDVYGFEPSLVSAHFTPIPCEEETYRLQHDLAAECVPLEGGLNRCSLELNRPPKSIGWQKWKTAMERDAKDPRAIEVPEADLHELNQRLQVTFDLRPGEVTLAGAGMKGDNVYVDFVRLIETDTGPAGNMKSAVVEVPQSSSVWVVETPEAWSRKLLTAEVDFHKVAQEVMAAALAGKEAMVTGLSAQTLEAESRGFHREMEPRIYFGDYLNTAPAPEGIFFNPRTVYQSPVGLQMSMQGGVIRPCSINDVGEPAWRHWGIWEPAVKATRRDNSGVVQPSFPTCSLDIAIRPSAAPLQILGVMKVAAQTEPSAKPVRLRWYLLQSNAKAAADAPIDLVNERITTVQAVVLKAPEVSQTGETADAVGLLARAAAGDIQVLDLVTVAKHFEGSTNATVGDDYHFTTARSPPPGVNVYDFDLKASPQMPAGTMYDDQIRLRNRLVGFRLNLHDNHWKIERDSDAPRIVTDTFDDAVQEWPNHHLSRNESPKVTVCVQRPIFTIEERAGELPAVGECSVTPLSNENVLIIRRLK